MWARFTAEGPEYFWIETALSKEQLVLQPFEFQKILCSSSRSIGECFGCLEKITHLPLVAELLTIFQAGLLPISMGAPLCEKERNAAFAAPHPLAWVDLCDICAPLLGYVCAPCPETNICYECTTHKSSMLRVVHRGNMDKTSSWCQDRTDFVQHGQLALLKQAFPMFVQE